MTNRIALNTVSNKPASYEVEPRQEEYSEEIFNFIDTDGDGKISLNEKKKYTEIESKYQQISKEFREKNGAISHHDKESSLALCICGLFVRFLGKCCKHTKLPSLEECAEKGREVKNPKFYTRFMKIDRALSKGVILLGSLIALAGIGDIIMANRSESKRKKLMIEYSDKMYGVVKENPDNKYARKCYDELEEYFNIQADESRFVPKHLWDKWF